MMKPQNRRQNQQNNNTPKEETVSAAEGNQTKKNVIGHQIDLSINYREYVTLLRFFIVIPHRFFVIFFFVCVCGVIPMRFSFVNRFVN